MVMGVKTNKKANKMTPALEIETETKWYIRLWWFISNPITYILFGKIRW